MNILLQARVCLTRKIALAAVCCPSPVVILNQSAKQSLQILSGCVTYVCIRVPEQTNACACECAPVIVISTTLQ
jgi:hypothetical protein